MSLPQSVTFWSATVAYTVATVAIFSALGLRREGAYSTSRWAATVAVGLHVLALGVRWFETGHFPYVGNYEGALFGTLLIGAGFIALAHSRGHLTSSGVIALPAVLVTLGWGLTQADPGSAVPVVYQSPWLFIHFTFAWTTYAVYLLAAGIAVGVLVRDRAKRKGRSEPWFSARLPEDARLDVLSVRLVAFGFLMNAVTLASGAIWAYRLWGSYWNWDPVETWTLATWIAYGFYLHAKLTLGWSRRRLAWVAIVALFGVTMATWGVQLVPTSYHLFRDLGGSILRTSRPQ